VSMQRLGTELVSLMQNNKGYRRIYAFDHNASYYMRNTSYKVKTRCKKTCFDLFSRVS